MTYTFKHALIRDAAYATLSRRKRQRLHSRIVDALESAFPFTVETEPQLLAHHLAEAGFTDRAVEYLGKAGRRSIERSANADAIKYLTRALELLQSRPDTPQGNCARFSLEVMLAQAMTATYGYAATSLRETLLRAKTLINDLTDPAQKFASYMGYGPPTTSPEKQPSRGTQLLSSLRRRSTPMTRLHCALRTDSLAPPT